MRAAAFVLQTSLLFLEGRWARHVVPAHLQREDRSAQFGVVPELQQHASTFAVSVCSRVVGDAWLRAHLQRSISFHCVALRDVTSDSWHSLGPGHLVSFAVSVCSRVVSDAWQRAHLQSSISFHRDELCDMISDFRHYLGPGRVFLLKFVTSLLRVVLVLRR